MSLTKDDLQAIQQVIVATVKPMIDELSMDTANGFAEVDAKFQSANDQFDTIKNHFDSIESAMKEVKNDISELRDTTGRIENKLNAAVSHGDDLGDRISKLEKSIA